MGKKTEVRGLPNEFTLKESHHALPKYTHTLSSVHGLYSRFFFSHFMTTQLVAAYLGLRGSAAGEGG